MKMTSIINILSAISDDKALTLFKTIAFENNNSDTLLNKTKLTRKQYYSKTADLIKAGLVKRRSGRYFLTAYGKIVYDAHILVEKAINNYWKLKVIDSLDSKDLSKDEYAKVVNTLIDNNNNKIKEIILT
jgi:predicted transcriptional regulator